MELTINECRQILKTLPLGYYCGRRVPVELNETEETSFYNPLEDKIVISYPIIYKGMGAVVDEEGKERAVRSMLYHELSHVILTPDNIFRYCDSQIEKNVVNTFEDERIETLLNQYYMNTNFKEQLYRICGDDPEVDVKDPFSVFYALVRYRFGKPDLLREVETIINKYRNINRRTTYYNGTVCTNDYVSEIFNLWRKICNAVRADDMEKDSMIQKLPMSAESINIDKSATTPTSSKEGTPADEGAEGTPTDEEIEGMPMVGQLSNEEAKELATSIFDRKSEMHTGLTPKQAQDIDRAKKTIETLIANFNKRNSGGQGYNAYSGIFNPRAVCREDYKYFDRIAQANGNNPFGTCHLNLVIDNSGSFYHNTAIINALLLMLTDIEKKTPNFSLDVSFIGMQFTTCKNKQDRKICCGGGNTIPDDYSQIMEKLQKPNSYNYNIVLFDGDALSDYHGKETKAQRFHHVDRANTCLITDSDNERYIKDKPFKKARIIVTSAYTDELIKNIVYAFGRMFG